MPATDSSVSYLRPKELAETLRVTPRTLGRWRKEGNGPAFVKRGRVVRYRTDDVDSWARTSGAAAA
jgi:excisionase family DNA binding protein